jgi:hypothetical protein
MAKKTAKAPKIRRLYIKIICPKSMIYYCFLSDKMQYLFKMTGSKTILLTATLAVLLVSCSGMSEFNITEENLFYAQNMNTGAYYMVSAEMLAEGDTCVVWVEKGSGVTVSMARDFAAEYDTIVRPRVADTLSKKNFTEIYRGSEYYFNDMLHYANWLTGNRNNGKLTILLLDIKDDFPKTDSYVAGYFFLGNFYPRGKIEGTAHYSNGVDMIYIDTYPGLEGSYEQAYSTLAHELQHLINFVTSIYTERDFTDTWVDEGLSSFAEYLYFGENLPGKCEWFSNMSETIVNGNNFFVWDNHEEEPLAILDDYATVYLFFRWLHLQAGNESIFYEIENSDYSDYQAVTSAAAKINLSWNNWEALLGNWLAANYSPTNPEYGYKNDSYLQETIKIKPIAGLTISLYPGEGVYSIINGSYSATNSGNIRYAGLSDSAPSVSSPYTGNVLLTFNANTENYDYDNRKVPDPETGKLTGEPVPASQILHSNGRSTKPFTRPFVIDARDILGRDREKSLPDVLVPFRNEP